MIRFSLLIFTSLINMSSISVLFITFISRILPYVQICAVIN